MEKKSVFFLVLAASIALSAFGSGQQSAAPAAGPVTLTLWQGTNPTLNSLFEQFIKEFQEKNPTVTINFEVTPTRDMLTKLIPALAANQGPEMVTGNQQFYTPLVEQNLCFPVPDSIVNDAFMQTTYIPKADVGRSFGQRFAVPTGIQGPVLYVNTEYLKEAGITDMGKTWDEVLANAEKLTKWKGDVIERAGLVVMQAPAAEGYMLMDFVYQQGGKFYSADGKKAFLNTPEMLKAIKMLRTIFERKISAIGLPSCNESFGTGKAAATVMWTWYGSTLNATYPNLKWSAQQVPRFTNSGPYGRSNSLSDIIFITRKTTAEKLPAAWNFWKYASIDQNARFAQAAGTVPVKKDGIDAQWINSRPDLVQLKKQILDPAGGYVFPVSVPQPILDYMTAIADSTIMKGGSMSDEAIKKILADYEAQLNQHLERRNYPFSPEA